MSLRLEDIQAFLNVVELGSISAAAERMSLSKSVISKRVSDLERHLGVRLLYRSTRNVEPTEAGGFFYKSAKASLQDLNNAAESVALRENDLCGELRVMAPMSFGTLWLGPLVMEFMARNPRLEVVLQLDDRIVDFEKEGYDLAIRITRLQDSSLIARQLGTSRRVVCCSPEYLERHGPLQRIEDILCHPCIGYSHNTPSQLWSFEPRVAGEPARMITPRGRFNTNNGQTMRDAAVRGLGLAMLPLFIAAEDLAAGRLAGGLLAAADRQQRVVHPRVVLQRQVELLDAAGIRTLRLRFEYPAAPQHVVEKHQPTLAHQRQRGLQVFGVVGLVGVDEGQVELPGQTFVEQRTQGFQGGPEAQLDALLDSGFAPVAARGEMVVAGQVATGKAPLLAKGGSHAQGAVAGEGADLQRPPRADQGQQQGDELALFGGDLPARVGQLRGFLAQAGHQRGFPQRNVQQVAVEVIVEVEGAGGHRP